MKRNLIILGLLLSVFSVAHAVPVSDPANPHNMSSLSDSGTVRALPPASGGTEEICIFCHTPHSAAPQTPLWGRPDPNTMGSFPVYAQPLGIKTNTALTGYDSSNPEYPSGTSRMCLSCHDGATSVGVMIDNQTIIMEGGLTNLSMSIDLSTSHPISFNYNINVLALLAGGYTLPTLSSTPLDGAGQVQCTTCHDPHEDTRGDSSYGSLPFWRHQGNATSYDDVCTSCHSGTPGKAPHP